MNSSVPKLAKFKQAAQKVSYQTRPGPALISTPENQKPNREIEANKNETVKKKTFKEKRSKFVSFFVSPVKKIYRRFGLKHLGPIFIMIGYAFFGGWLFSYLELDNEIERKALKNEQLEKSAYNLSLKIVSICKSSLPENETMSNVIEQLAEYQNNAGLVPDDSITWDVWGGMFFAGTVFTTIGYGHYYPVTRNGRIAVMLYALIGIPLVLAILNDFGKLLTMGLSKIYTSLRNVCMRCYHIVLRKGEYSVSAESVDKDLPVPIAIIFIVAYLFICSAIFCLWEKNWSYFDAFYFFFISMSTIGLGDITPDHPKFMICGCVLVLIGLTLVSLVINLIQNKLERLKELTTGALENLTGFDEDTESEGDAESPGDKGISAEKKIEDYQRVTMGVIQSFQKVRKNRRRIGIQTDESCLRDLWLKEKEDKQPLLNGELPSVHQMWKPKKSPEADRKSIGSFDTTFYDASSDLEG